MCVCVCVCVGCVRAVGYGRVRACDLCFVGMCALVCACACVCVCVCVCVRGGVCLHGALKSSMCSESLLFVVFLVLHLHVR